MASFGLHQNLPGFASIPLPPNPPKKEPYRYYACELKWNGWYCSRTQEKTWNPSTGSLITQLVPVQEQIPTFLDALMLGYTLKKPVAIIPSQNQNSG